MPDAGSDRAKVAIFISGSGTNMGALLYASRQPGSAYEVVLVASNNPDAGGLKLAEAEGVPTFVQPHKGMARADHDAAMEQAARKAGAEYIALAGYMRILGEEFVRRWAGRMLNIHPSLLPRYKGLDTHARAIAAGDSHGGASVHIVTPELDDGEVLGQAKVAILPDDTADSLAARVLLAEHQLYPRALGAYVSRGSDPDHLLERVRRLALALPQTHERESHGAPGWRAGSEKSGKYFAYFSDCHHGEPHVALLAKTSGTDEMTALIERDPETFYRPAYYGASGWVGIVLNRRDTDWSQVEHWLERSWRAVAPKSATKLLDAADEF
ncbi:phosphoribosylglycinamide formyltransferase [Altererythrobacter arenosus]|uniref:Phosphoribosylglycinamide formyltransferase n=1 Tax=Altererythrobacter arenosus TaxID=3032592 RepID=A0ABY8FN99_9SPHN|nr:phosphoribosylglycinamide formyltransferase [Altererythrobacter sp. CAU 1644]WFL76497.1 phosphoribosylglycinamide formyltransferase [Altererythrobacter sp. CAU 1644]